MRIGSLLSCFLNLEHSKVVRSTCTPTFLGQIALFPLEQELPRTLVADSVPGRYTIQFFCQRLLVQTLVGRSRIILCVFWLSHVSLHKHRGGFKNELSNVALYIDFESGYAQSDEHFFIFNRWSSSVHLVIIDKLSRDAIRSIIWAWNMLAKPPNSMCSCWYKYFP